MLGKFSTMKLLEACLKTDMLTILLMQLKLRLEVILPVSSKTDGTTRGGKGGKGHVFLRSVVTAPASRNEDRPTGRKAEKDFNSVSLQYI